MLSYVLRHGAAKEGYSIDSAGYILVSEICNHKGNFRLNLTEALIRDIVYSNDKQRYELSETDGPLKIRAAQGHTIKGIDDKKLLE